MVKEIKITVVGNSNVGKTCLLISYATNSFPAEYVPTVFDNYNTKAVVEGTPIDAVLIDTAGDSEYDSMRPLNYPGTNVFLVCFSVMSHDSAYGVLKKWVDEVRAKCPDVPVVIVGTKIDLRNDEKEVKNLKAEGKEPVSKSQGEQIAEAIGAHKYLECSALTQEGLSYVFEETMKLVLHPKPAPKSNPEKLEKMKTGGCLIQ